jgi:hypothetical protein
MKQLFILFAIALVFFACKKEKEATDPCPTGKIRFNNTSGDSYYIYLDGEYKAMVTAGAFKEYEVGKGQHTTKAQQVGGGGYKEGECTVLGCDTQKFEF